MLKPPAVLFICNLTSIEPANFSVLADNSFCLSHSSAKRDAGVQIGRVLDYEINVRTGSGFWGLPKDMPSDRSPIVINTSDPAAAGAGAEVLAAAAAALSATSILLESSQSGFAAAALNKAHLLFDLAEQMGPQINRTLDDLRDVAAGSNSSGNANAAAVGVEVFGSSSVMDDMAFAATWLAKASGTGCANGASTRAVSCCM